MRPNLINNLLLYGLVANKSIRKAKSSGRINTWLSLYDGTDYLDNCMWFGQKDIEEGDIVKAFVTQSEKNPKYETCLYFLKGSKING